MLALKQVLSLGWEDPLEDCIATHSSIFARRIPMDRGAWWVIVYGVKENQIQLSMCISLSIYFVPVTEMHSPHIKLIHYPNPPFKGFSHHKNICFYIVY